MNEQLQQALADLINKGIGGLDQTKDFLTAEIPDVIQQLLIWYGVYNFIWFLTSIFCFCFVVYAFNNNFKVTDWGDDYPTKEAIKAFVFDGFGLFLFILGLSRSNVEWLQIWIAPKVWLIEYASQLVK